MHKNQALRDMIYSSMFAAIISVLGMISIPLPFVPVPITAQSLGVMLAGIVLTTKQASLSVAIFLALGAFGIPVFSGGKGGIAIFATTSGGYLLGFLIGAIVISFISSRSENIFRIGAATLLGGIVVIYFLGALWISISTHIGLLSAIALNSPFLPGDLFKAFVATAVGCTVNRRMKQLMPE